MGRVVDRPEPTDRDPEVDVEAPVEHLADQRIVELDLGPVVVLLIPSHL